MAVLDGRRGGEMHWPLGGSFPHQKVQEEKASSSSSSSAALANTFLQLEQRASPDEEDEKG